MCFWNIAGLMNKCEETWKYLEEFDMVGLVETWVEEESWKKIKDIVPNKYVWTCLPAVKEHKKGRAKGGIITAISKKFEKTEGKLSNGALENKVKYNGNKWRIITLYSQKIEETMNVVTEQIPEEENECIILEGDFNARTANKGGPVREEEEEKGESRYSIRQSTEKDGC